VAVDGNTLTLHLESPLDNLLGFEHAARTDKEKAAVGGMVERLNKADGLFVTTAAAGCKPAAVQLESPLLQPPKTTGAGGHADLDGDFIFRCERPELLRDIDVALFDAFPNLHRVDVQVAGARGQTAAKLTPTSRRVAW